MTAQPIRNALDRLLAQDRWELEHVTAGREALDALLERLQALEAACDDFLAWHNDELTYSSVPIAVVSAIRRAALRKEGTPQ